MRFAAALPIDDATPRLLTALRDGANAVVIAPPGAGKTTRLPLALIEEPWCANAKVLVLEPRRLAARGAAARMAETLGQRLGETIGLKARLSSHGGPRTRVDVVTEGVFTRMILDDPGLEGVAAVLFDEFHERSLDADLGLALALDAQRALRPDLKLVVMSATLDGARAAALLGGAPVIESVGRAYPVETVYLGRSPGRRIEEQMTAAILKAVRAERGSVLAFLPGQGEIHRVADDLADRLADSAIDIAPLSGAMELAAQARAIAPAAPGRRKIVLATAIAETSITIEGVRVVVDCGLARVPRYDADVGVTRLDTVRVSRAAADQRRGRAGRTEPGVCYRLWDEAETRSLIAFAEPEIKAAGLSSLVLDCAAWGETDPYRLAWLDPPPEAAWRAAVEELGMLGALDGGGRITAAGRRLRALALPPRLARMVLAGRDAGSGLAAAEIAAVLVERGLGGTSADLDDRLAAFRRDRGSRAEQMRQLARRWAREGGARPQRPAEPVTTAELLALAYPERIAKARGAPGQYLLANGRGAMLDAADPLARSPFLVVAELQGSAARARILAAAALEVTALEQIAAGRIADSDEVTFDRTTASLRCRRVRRLDAIVLAAEPRSLPPGIDAAGALARGFAEIGIGRLPWSKAHQQLRDRVAFLRAAAPPATAADWPDLSDQALGADGAAWLAPWLAGKAALADVTADDLAAALEALLPWALRQRLEREAPTHYEAPTGSRHAIDYGGEGAPALHIRVQELYGLKSHPAIGDGRLPLTLHLLSPAHRPIQITRDLPAFWSGSWAAVRADMRGRYPRHPWPEDPANALPTSRAKPRGS
jgi:ATP-dependent helicase HrpB